MCAIRGFPTSKLILLLTNVASPFSRIALGALQHSLVQVLDEDHLGVTFDFEKSLRKDHRPAFVSRVPGIPRFVLRTSRRLSRGQGGRREHLFDVRLPPGAYGPPSGEAEL